MGQRQRTKLHHALMLKSVHFCIPLGPVNANSWSQNQRTTRPDSSSLTNHPAGQQAHPSLTSAWGLGGLSKHPVTWGDPEAEQILGNKMLIQPATQAVTDSPVPRDSPSKTWAFQNSEECSPRVCANDSKANYGSSDLTKADFLRWPSEGSNGHS